MKRFVPALAVSAAMALAVSACGSSPSSDKSSDKTTSGYTSVDALVTAAKAEGTVKIYTQMTDADTAKMNQAFTAKYGIKVDNLRVGGNDLYTRFQSEADANSDTADLIVGTDPIAFKTLEDSGKVLGFSASGVAKLLPDFPSKYYLKADDVALFQTIDTGFIYNTTKVTEADIPKKWADLGSSKFAGKVCIVDPSTSISFATFTNTIRASEGDDVLKAIGKNLVRLYPNVINLNEAVASGECGIGLNSAAFFVPPLAAKGSPVAFAHMPTAVYNPTVMAANAKAKHPAAARLYLHFFESKEGSAVTNVPNSGSFGPYSTDMPSTFKFSTAAEINKAQADTQTILGLVTGK